MEGDHAKHDGWGDGDWSSNSPNRRSADSSGFGEIHLLPLIAATSGQPEPQKACIVAPGI
jgi:hypothetical protein